MGSKGVVVCVCVCVCACMFVASGDVCSVVVRGVCGMFPIRSLGKLPFLRCIFGCVRDTVYTHHFLPLEDQLCRLWTAV